MWPIAISLSHHLAICPSPNPSPAISPSPLLVNPPSLVHVAVVTSDHLQVQGGSGVAIEVSNETVGDLGAPFAKVGSLHDGVLANEFIHDCLDTFVVLVTGNDGTLCVVVVIDKLETNGGKVFSGFLPDTSREGVTPEEETPGLEDADNLIEDLLLEVSNDDIGDVGLTDNYEVNTVVLSGGLVSAVPDAVGDDLAG